ncbi:hypothetical protein MMC17_005997 [Xylographa soralifera]|nr:hypothetical protein [Xylographa soralifera]
MDPLSLTVSIIALFGAGGSAAKGLRKIISLKDAPDELQQLNNEVSGICMIVSTIKDCCRYREDHSLVVNAESNYVSTTLQRAKDLALELDIFVAYELTKVVANGDKVDRIAWLRAGGKVGKLKDRLRYVKVDLGVAVNLLNLTYIQQLEYRPVQMHLTDEPLRQRQLDNHTSEVTHDISQSAASQRRLEFTSNTSRGRGPSDFNPPISEALRALYNSKYDCIETFLAAGADIAQEDDHGVTPYSIAWTDLPHILSGWTDNRPPFRGFFGSRPDFEKLGLSELHVAVLGWGSTSFDAAIASTPRSFVNEQDLQGRTALSYAAQCGSIHITRKLLLKGADPKIGDRLGRRPLCFLARTRLEDERVWDEMLYLLFCDDGIDHKDCDGRTVLHHVCNSRFTTPTVLVKLVALGADIKTQNCNGYDALQCVIERDSKYGLEIANWLLSNGADTRAQNNNGCTSVMLALIQRKVHFLELLLARGADYTLPDRFNRNVLLNAATCGNLDSLSVPQQAGIALQNPNAKDTFGWTPMKFALRRRDYNTQWTDWGFGVPDEDPEKFFEAFEALYQSIERRSKGMDWKTSSDPVSAADVEEEAHRRLPGSFPND